MNERIRELAEQADIFINKSNCVESGNGTEIIGWHIEKFAELILMDVLDICEDLGDKGQDGHYCVDKIRRVFGV